MKTFLNLPIVTAFFPSFISRRFFMLLFYLFSFAFVSLATSNTKIDNIPLAGIYTIGGDTPDFVTIKAAVDSLRAYGVSDAVVFNIRDGVYEGILYIPEIEGTSANNTITFQSESGDSTKVTITFTNIYTNISYYTITLLGADWMQFKDLTIEAKGETSGGAIELRNGAAHNVFKGNILKSVVTTNLSFGFPIVYSPQESVNSHNQFIQNTFLNGTSGIYFAKRLDESADSTIIQNNIFKNQAGTAIYLREHNAAQIIANSFYSDIENEESIYLIGCNYGTNVLENKIIKKKGSGMYLANRGNEGQPITIANNFISISDRLDLWEGGIIIGGSYQYFFHNTVHIVKDRSNYGAFSSISGENEKVYNNIFTNDGLGNAVYLKSFSSLESLSSFQSDFNNLFTKGRNIGFIEFYLSTDTFEFATLTDWQQTLRKDSNSLSLDPLFTNLEHYEVNQTGLNNQGIFLDEITEDIAGNTRNMESPDIGVLEWTPSSLDITPQNILGIAIPFSTTPQDIQIALRNNGLTTVEKATINWKINEVIQSPFIWNGQLQTGETDTFSIGMATFLPAHSNTVTVWTNQPNDVFDKKVENDTFQLKDITPGLAGIYTIGGENPDFVSFSEAITTLEHAGVLDSVTFNVRDGIYEEQLVINPYPNADSLRHVTFQSESGDSNKVILTYTATRLNNFTLQLNGADWLRFKGMTLAANNADFGRVIEITNESNHISLSNNLIKGIDTETYSYFDLHALVYSIDTHLNEHLTVQNNRLTNGSYGVYYTADRYASGTIIKNNIFTNQYVNAINLANHFKPIINHNYIIASTYSETISIYVINTQDGGTINGNHIIIEHGKTGIYVGTYSGESILVANNFIKIGKKENYNVVYGIQVRNSGYARIIHNTVHVADNSGSSAALYFNNGINKQVYNNIFANLSGGLTMYSTNIAAALDFSDYNNLYTTGRNLAQLRSIKYASLADIQTSNSLGELHSFSVEPIFINTNTYKIAQNQLRNTGLKNNLVTTDIEGEVRDTLPDIGADEFDIPLYDASIEEVYVPELPFLPTNQLISVRLKNYGASVLSNVLINWEVNGVRQPTINWSGNLLFNEETIVKLDNVFFNNLTAFDIECWTENPNGNMNTFIENDTANIQQVMASLAGIYTIGGIAPDFSTFDEAIDRMNQVGIADAVTFKIRDGIYQEQIWLTEVVGTDSLNTITFESESEDRSKVVLREEVINSRNNFILRLNEADWITFRKLTFESLNDQAVSPMIMLDGNTSHNTFSHNLMKAKKGSNKTFIHGPYIGGSQKNIFTNNHFINGGSGIYLHGSRGTEAKGITITNNFFENFTTTSIECQFVDDFLISENTIKNSQSTIIDLYGIKMAACNLGEITNNDLSIKNGDNGIYLSYCNGTADQKMLIANNRVKMISDSSWVTGINSEAGEYQDIYHNTVSILSRHKEATAFQSFGGSDIQVVNNIFSNLGNGYAYKMRINSLAVSNYNNLYTSGENLCSVNTEDLNSLVDWQASSSQDSESISVNPQFINDTSDLHVTNVLLNQAGKPLPNVIRDIDYQFRDPIKPDIGADEFLQGQHDGGINQIIVPAIPFEEGIHPVKVSIINFGLDTLNTADIHWLVDGQSEPAYNWTGVLPPNQQTDSINIGNFDFTLTTNGHKIQAWTKNPNDTTDYASFNDSSCIRLIYPALDGIYTIGGESPDFQSFIAAITALTNGGIVGNVIFNVRNGVYDEQLLIPEIAGADSLHTITFQSESQDSSQVILQTDQGTEDNNYLISLAGADWFRFKNMTFKNNGDYFARIIDINNEANHNCFENNSFLGKQVMIPSLNYTLIYSEKWNDNYNRFKNNYFLEGSLGFYLIGESENETIIENNTFVNQYGQGIFLSKQLNLTIYKNTIYTNSSYESYTGICISYSFDNLKIIKNTVSSINSGNGIFLHDVSIEKPQGLIANNFVNMGQNSDKFCSGVLLTNINNFKLYSNTVRVNSNNTQSRAFVEANTKSISVKNNIFACINNGYAYYKDSGQNTDADYNLLFSQNSALAYWNSLDVTTLENWQINTNQDSNSISILPNFISETDLHIKDSLINGAGIPLPEITTDIDGDPRDPNHPDIGADEFDFFKNDIGIIAVLSPMDSCNLSQLEQITVIIENFGRATQKDFQIGYQLANGHSIVETAFGLELESGDTAIYTFSTPIDLSNHETYQLACFTVLVTDSKLANDTFKVVIKNHHPPNIITNSLPLDGATNLNLPIDFVWQPSPDVNRYGLHLWEAADMPSIIPIVEDLADNYYLYRDNDLKNNATYHWQVIAKNDFCETAGEVQSFTVKGLPNLAIKNMEIPFSPIVGQPIEVTWTVENMGSSTDGSQWYDFVYLSESENFDEETATYLGGFPNVKVLNTGESYTQNQALDLPITTQGAYFVFVITDVFDRVGETTLEDNQSPAYSICKPILPKADITLNLVAQGVTEISPSEMMSMMPTDCDTPEIWLNRTIFDCSAIGLNQLTLYAQNQAGAIDSVAVLLMITDENIVCNRCQAVDLLLETPILNADIHIAGNSITATGKINKDTTVILRAGNSINLLPGFHAAASAIFWAQILDCSTALNGEEVTDTMPTYLLRNNLKAAEKSTKITLKTSPNPFKESTNIQFNLPTATTVNLAIYDVNGQLVTSLIQAAFYEEGQHQQTFENDDYAPNIYFLVLQTENAQMMQKLMLIR